MRKVIIWVLFAIALVLPLVSAVQSSEEGDGSGEAFFDSLSDSTARGMCEVFGFQCDTVLSESRSYGADQDIIDRYEAGTEANEPLSEQRILENRIDNARDRTTQLYSLIGSFWTLLLVLLEALFIFIQVYLVLWGIFILIPKMLTFIIKKTIDGGVFGK